MNGRSRVVCSSLILAAGVCLGHGVGHDARPAAGVAFRYDDGSPMAYAEVTVLAPGGGQDPFLSGGTDRNGCFAFCPDGPGVWRVRADDGMGHADEAEVVVGADGWAATARHHHVGLGRGMGLAVGLGVIFGLAGLAVLPANRRRARVGREG